MADTTIYMASSSGGHIDLLVRARAALNGHPLVWVTQDSIRARALCRNGERVELLPDWSRSLGDASSIAVNVARSLRLAARHRPRVIVTSGSGLIVPFCVFSATLGAKLVFIETPARVTSPSQAGRVLSRIACTTLVHWPSMLHVYPHAEVCRPAVLDQLSAERQGGGEGTYVAVGTHSQAFDRLLRLVDDAVGRGVLPRPVIAQTGVSTYAATNYESRAWMEPGAVEDAMAASRYVITHGGTGSISTALRHGRRPMVLPRLKRHDEHFDDHQEQLVDELSRMGVVVRLGRELTENDLRAVDVPLALGAAMNQPAAQDALKTAIDALI